MSLFRDEMTLEAARETLRPLAYDKGHDCPCCRQFVKIYPFPINAAMARVLIQMWKKNGTDWVNVPDLKAPGGHFAKMRFWGLIEKPPELRRADGSARAGIWRVTLDGEAWLTGNSMVWSHARLYNNHCYGLEGKPVTIVEVLGKKFDYSELMGR